MGKINIVTESVARTVSSEFCKFYENCASRIVAAKNAFLIVVEIAISHGQVDAFLPDADAVVVWNGRACKLDILNGCVVPRNHPNPFTLRTVSCGVDHRPPCAHAD